MNRKMIAGAAAGAVGIIAVIIKAVKHTNKNSYDMGCTAGKLEGFADGLSSSRAYARKVLAEADEIRNDNSDLVRRYCTLLEDYAELERDYNALLGYDDEE